MRTISPAVERKKKASARIEWIDACTTPLSRILMRRRWRIEL
ncbi:MAG: hypothetical protein PHE55_20090 [Methylococcaceae bacterium]|nr:hypothetical protein [Methylococcaceae bacterium]